MRRVGSLVLMAAGCAGDGDGVVADAAGLDGAAGEIDGGPADAAGAESSRDRLIRTYLERLQAIPTVMQSNGLRGGDLDDVCELWSSLDPSARAVFLTITARLDGSTLVADGSTMLDHVTRMTRVRGGVGATASDPGECGGEGNRLFLTVDAALHAALVAVADGDGGIDDIPDGAVWRNTTDAAGPHDPFDASDETERGAPRAQGHFFRDPASALAAMPLGRVDVEALVDPYAFEIDQDYDCVHASNPLCDYTFYGPLCAPATTASGVDIYEGNYGSYLATWVPTGC